MCDGGQACVQGICLEWAPIVPCRILSIGSRTDGPSNLPTSDGPRSGMRWGELLLHKKWPVLLAISIALALYVADLFGVFCNILEFAGLKLWMWSEGTEITKA